MITTIGVRETIKNLSDLRTYFNLTQTEDDNFFREWYEELPEITETENIAISRIKQRYDYHRQTQPLLEGTINLLVISPLLEIAGFFDPPFKISSPESIQLIIEDPDQTIIKGMIDVLVIQETLWILVVESKRTSIPVPSAFPQILAYMMANSQKNKPTFGMVTNGDSFVFLKLSHQENTPKYDVSREFSLFPRRHELTQVLQILKRLSKL
ncbi:type I restriction endonuclease subunit R [Aphanothece sacrum]|uniref:Type I restriction endonuclease subunit R n=1 Tax=Aphanothece sacrum FPU1 TaxID=1920663 RepID=A0A401IHA3_APHSA|nr:type I restriction endonuclease subunit R [Aphanothece sacrum]GBF80586.1 type I restriction endonuclease subunit R [Aphanothece sacrum FPU1]GBF84024.1 type I restriction endonuclease subunit R [Aphanothece sacrum FPU3]